MLVKSLQEVIFRILDWFLFGGLQQCNSSGLMERHRKIWAPPSISPVALSQKRRHIYHDEFKTKLSGVLFQNYMCNCISNLRHLLHHQHDLRTCVFTVALSQLSFPDEKSSLFSRSKPINRQLIVFQANKDSTSIFSQPRGCWEHTCHQQRSPKKNTPKMNPSFPSMCSHLTVWFTLPSLSQEILINSVGKISWLKTPVSSLHQKHTPEN